MVWLCLATFRPLIGIGLRKPGSSFAYTAALLRDRQTRFEIRRGRYRAENINVKWKKVPPSNSPPPPPEETVTRGDESGFKPKLDRSLRTKLANIAPPSTTGTTVECNQGDEERDAENCFPFAITTGRRRGV